LGPLFLIGLLTFLLAICFGYTGRYFGCIEGFAAAKAQYYMQGHSQLKLNQLLSKVLEPKLSFSSSSSSPLSATKPISRPNTTQQLQQQVVMLDRWMKQADRLNQQQSKQTYSVAKLTEKNAGCRWTVGSLG